MAPIHHVAAAGVVRNHRGEVLLIRGPLRGWEIPGGVVESHESVEAALKREIWEESGAEVEVAGFLGLCKNVERDIVNLEFCCSCLGGQLRGSSESLEAGWFSPEEARKILEDQLSKIWVDQALQGEGVRCFAFRKDPFTILEDGAYPAISGR